MEQRNKPGIGIDKVVIASGNGGYSTTGFTLIEVMVTLTVLGFILLIIFGAFRLGLSAWNRGETTKQEYQRVRIISQMISQQIKSVVPFKVKSQKAEGNYLGFEGKGRSLKFVSAFPMKAKQSEGFVFVIYEFKEGGPEDGRLMVYEQRVLNRDFFAEEPKEELGVSILEGISNVRFEYFREEDLQNNKPEEWVEEWDAKEEKELPKALRMTITQKSGKKGGEEFPITIQASLPANRFDEVRTTPLGVGRRTMQRVPQR